MANEPLVTVIVAVYNQAKFIEHTIKSIINQTYINIEILISDDCSTDDSGKILKLLSDEDSRIRLFLQSENLGITKNFNFLTAKATGKYVATFAGDDVMLPNKIAQQVKILEENSNASFCHHSVTVIDSLTSKPLGLLKYNYLNDITTIHHVLRDLGIPGGMSIMYKRAAIQNPVFDPNIPVASDWLFIIKLTMAGRGLYIKDSLCFYRKDISYNGKNPIKYENDFIKTIELTRSLYANKDNSINVSCNFSLSRFALGAGFRRLIKGDSKEARLFFKQAMLERKFLLPGAGLYFLSYFPINTLFFLKLKRLIRR
jgi:glycosyltransferase involved in cell wall biosynthesis